MDFIKPTVNFCRAAIDVDGHTFNLRNVYEEGTGFTHIDIYDEEGKFLDEYASGFGADRDDDIEERKLNAEKVSDYIRENLMFSL